MSFCCSCLRRSQAQSVVYIVRKKRERCLIYLDRLCPITSRNAVMTLDRELIFRRKTLGKLERLARLLLRFSVVAEHRPYYAIAECRQWEIGFEISRF